MPVKKNPTRTNRAEALDVLSHLERWADGAAPMPTEHVLAARARDALKTALTDLGVYVDPSLAEEVGE